MTRSKKAAPVDFLRLAHKLGRLLVGVIGATSSSLSFSLSELPSLPSLPVGTLGSARLRSVTPSCVECDAAGSTVDDVAGEWGGKGSSKVYCCRSMCLKCTISLSLSFTSRLCFSLSSSIARSTISK